MDKLLLCAKAFEPLLHTKYHIIIGRKGKAVELTICFEAIEFHHLVGLHKLRDNRLARGNREKIFYDILSGKTTQSDIEKSIYFHTIQNRFEPFIQIENLFDQNNLIFRYNPKLQALSMIEAEYLLSTPHENTDIYIFLDKKGIAGEFFCRSFFPKENTDYTKGQAVYTLLKKEKIDTLTGNTQVQYDRLTPKTTKRMADFIVSIRFAYFLLQIIFCLISRNIPVRFFYFPNSKITVPVKIRLLLQIPVLWYPLCFLPNRN